MQAVGVDNSANWALTPLGWLPLTSSIVYGEGHAVPLLQLVAPGLPWVF
jgi:hypothetical protein